MPADVTKIRRMHHMKVKINPLQKEPTTAFLIFVYHVTGTVRVHHCFEPPLAAVGQNTALF